MKKGFLLLLSLLIGFCFAQTEGKLLPATAMFFDPKITLPIGSAAVVGGICDRMKNDARKGGYRDTDLGMCYVLPIGLGEQINAIQRLSLEMRINDYELQKEENHDGVGFIQNWIGRNKIFKLTFIYWYNDTYVWVLAILNR